MELFPSPNHPSQLETTPSLSQKMLILFYDSFLLFLAHKEIVLSFQKNSCFSPYIFSEFSRRKLHPPFAKKSFFYLCLLFCCFEAISLYLPDCFCHRVSYFSPRQVDLPQCALLTWKDFFHIIKLHN